MCQKWAGLAAMCIAVVGLVAVAVWAVGEQAQEEKLSLNKVPAPVKATILKEGGKVGDIERQTAGGKTIYEADVIKDGQEIELRIAADGKLIARNVEGAAEVGEEKEGEESEEGDESEEQSEARACVEGAKNLAKAKVTLVEALQTATKEGKGAKPFKADLEREEGKLLFDIELLDGAKGPEMEIDAITGKVLKIESVEDQAREDKEEGDQDDKEEQQEAKAKAVAAKALPLAKVTLIQAVETAVAQAPGGKAYKAELKPEGGRPRYEVQVVAGDECMEVAIDGVSGKVLEKEPKGSTKEDAATAGGWRDTFRVDKANLVPTGRNAFFILEPGYRLHLAKGKETLVISVLEDTKVVDGVTTRVVEEREAENGQLVEVSRNYFAIDKTTQDVYYFGEDVDMYRNGKVVKHEGAWLAGVKGARFGLMMPGKPVKADKFYQEVAPKVAMDRAEITNLDEKLTTPAGVFEHCLHVKETSPLERGVSHKVYAPGVGLLRDESLLLVKIEKPGK